MEYIATLSLLVVLVLVLVARRRDGRAGGPTGSQGPDQDDWTLLHLELERARRYDHGFALLQLVGQSLYIDGRCVCTRDGDADVLELRRTDSAWGGPDRVQVLVPEASQREVAGLLRRVRATLQSGIEVRAACFPDDGLTPRALVQALDPSSSTYASAVEATASFDGVPGSPNVPLRRAPEAS